MKEKLGGLFFLRLPQIDLFDFCQLSQLLSKTQHKRLFVIFVPEFL